MRSKFNRKQDMESRFKLAKRKNLLCCSAGIHPSIIVLDGLKPDFNIGKIFRTADAFSIKEIHLVNVDFFDPKPAKGSVKWMQFYQHDDFASCYESLADDGYEWITLEPDQKMVLGQVGLPEKAAFVFGHEEFGLSFDKSDYPHFKSLAIPQWGHVQSLNVSIATSIVLYEYVRQHGRPLSDGLAQCSSSVRVRNRRLA